MSEHPQVVRVGVVGVGRWGANYLRALPKTSGLRLVAACDADSAALGNVAEAAPRLDLVGDLNDLLPLVDAVVLATPSDTHAALAIRCLDAGKHVLVEKPLATDLGAASAVVARAEANERTLFVGHVTLCHPVLAMLRNVVAAGSIGPVRRIDAVRTSSGARHRRDSALWALGPHDIANVLFVSGASAVRVADVWRRGTDEARLELELDQGVPARMRWSRAALTAQRQLLVEGADGRLVFDEMLGSLELHRGGVVREIARAEPGLDLLRLQCERFLDAIRQDACPQVAAAVQVVRILAVAEGRRSQASEQKLSVPG